MFSRFSSVPLGTVPQIRPPPNHSTSFTMHSTTNAVSSCVLYFMNLLTWMNQPFSKTPSLVSIAQALDNLNERVWLIRPSAMYLSSWFLCPLPCLKNSATFFTCPNYTHSVEWWEDWWKLNWYERQSWFNLKHYHGISLKRLRRTTNATGVWV